MQFCKQQTLSSTDIFYLKIISKICFIYLVLDFLNLKIYY